MGETTPRNQMGIAVGVFSRKQKGIRWVSRRRDAVGEKNLLGRRLQIDPIEKPSLGGAIIIVRALNEQVPPWGSN